MVYFLKAIEMNLIKIGFTDGDDVSIRVASLQTASPATLELLASMPGDRMTEQALHAAFADLRVKGEWFRADDRLVGTINGIRDAAGQPSQGGDCWYWHPTPDDPFYVLSPVAEAAYRRGLHHAAFYARELITRARDVRTAVEIAGAMEEAFSALRYVARPEHDLGNRVRARLESRFSTRLLPGATR